MKNEKEVWTIKLQPGNKEMPVVIESEAFLNGTWQIKLAKDRPVYILTEAGNRVHETFQTPGEAVAWFLNETLSSLARG